MPPSWTATPREHRPSRPRWTVAAPTSTAARPSWSAATSTSAPRPPTLEQLRAERETALERVAGLSAGQAKQALLKEVEDEARHDAARVLRQVEEETKRDAERRVRVDPLRSRCSASPPATRRRRPCRSCSCPATT